MSMTNHCAHQKINYSIHYSRDGNSFPLTIWECEKCGKTFHPDAPGNQSLIEWSREAMDFIEKLVNGEIEGDEADGLVVRLLASYPASSPEIPIKSDAVRDDEKLREIIENAHMAGQLDAGVDPGYSNARAYCDKIFLARAAELDK